MSSAFAMQRNLYYSLRRPEFQSGPHLLSRPFA